MRSYKILLILLSIIIVLNIICNINCNLNILTNNNSTYKNLIINEIKEQDMIEYLKKGDIFIVRNFTNEFNYITPEYLVKLCGNDKIEAHTTINEQHAENVINITISDFFKRYKKEILYIKEDLGLIYNNSIYKQFDSKMKNYFTNLFMRYYFIWIGSRNSKTGLHNDMDDQNYLLQLYGTKKVYIFKSDDNSVFKPRIKQEGTALLSSIDFWSKEGDKLKETVEYKEIILNAGDILFLPKGWWHCAENITETIAMSCRSETIFNIPWILYSYIFEQNKEKNNSY